LLSTHIGAASRSTLGAMNVTLFVATSYVPMNECVTLSLMKATRDPSGDHFGLLLRPH
jgi:hypothetical protein